jgi:hypothetical protein
MLGLSRIIEVCVLQTDGYYRPIYFGPARP